MKKEEKKKFSKFETSKLTPASQNEAKGGLIVQSGSGQPIVVLTDPDVLW